MGQRLAFAIAAGLLAFVVVLLGALGAYVVVQKTTGHTVFAAPSTGAGSLAVPNSSGQAADRSAGLQQTQPGGASAANSYPISADDAVTIALSSTPGASLKQQPRLVSYGGTAAYEVPLDKGYVYVDANRGQVLYNGAGGVSRRQRGFRPAGR